MNKPDRYAVIHDGDIVLVEEGDDVSYREVQS